MKKLLTAMLLVLACVGLAGCGKYSSSYSSTKLREVITSTHAEISFGELEGRYVIRLNSNGEGAITYSATLEEGSATVYYDYADRKEELFTISGGQPVKDTSGYIEKGTVYVIIETDGACRGGEFEINI